MISVGSGFHSVWSRRQMRATARSLPAAPMRASIAPSSPPSDARTSLAPLALIFSSIVPINAAKSSSNASRPLSSSSAVIASRSTPSEGSSSSIASAPSTCSVTAAGRTTPWSRKALSVASGTVFTVSAPTSSSMYITSR